MREIILDTETTGLDPKAGHRVVEIGAIELINQHNYDHIAILVFHVTALQKFLCFLE